MPTYANIDMRPRFDGIVYASSVPMTSTEADLWNGSGPHPIPIDIGEAMQAVVQLIQQGGMTGQNSYVIMQTDLGDGVWIDVAGIVYTNVNVPGTFLLSGGIAGNNAFQQSRQVGGFPAANFSNAMVMGGRVRFVGKTTLTGGSSAAAGVTAGMLATVTYKKLTFR